MKNKLHKTNLFYLMLLFFAMSSCEKEAKLDQPAVAQKLAVLCNFSPNEPFSIELSKSQSIFSGTIEDNLVNEAHVSICLNNETIEEIVAASSDSDNKYESKIAFPEAKKIYTLKVEVDGVEMITATSEIPDPVEITHAAVGETSLLPNLSANPFNQSYNVRLSLQFDDPIDQTDYYQVNFYQEILSNVPGANPDSSKTLKAATGFSFINESLVQNLNPTDGGLLFKDTNFDGLTNEFLFQPKFEYDRNLYQVPSTIIIELRSISKEYYNYYTSVYRQSSQGSVPFSDPTVIFSNIENGYGVFAGYNKHQVKRPIEF